MDFLVVIIRTVDSFLAIPAVRWLLFVVVLIMLTVTGYSMSRQYFLSLQLSAAKGQVATYLAHLEVQNAAVRQLDEDSKRAKARISDANKEAARLREELDIWKKKPPVFTGTCDEMVKQAIAEVRR